MQIVDVKTLGGLRAARKKGAVYCGRGSPLGNPYRIGKDGNREAVIAKFRTYLWQQLTTEKNVALQQALDALHENSVLGCYCSPKPCHCEVIERAWHWWISEGRQKYGS